MPLMLHGIGIPGSVAIGRVLHGGAPLHAVVERRLAVGAVPAEQARYRRALAHARRQLRKVRSQIPRRTPADIRSFIDSHLLMLDDPAFGDAVTDRISTGSCNAEWALIQQREALLAVFDRIDDPYLRTRRDDVAHVVERVLAELSGPLPDDEKPAGGLIQVAESLGPADVLRLHQRGAAGFVTQTGGPLSHAAIVARSLHMPAVVGVRDARRLLRDGESIVLDSADGVVLAAPDQRAIECYRKRQRSEARARAALRALRDVPTLTRDGLAVALLANIEQPGDLRAVRRAGATGVGLYRTEFLFLNRGKPPGEAEQYAAYAKVVDRMRGRPVTIRTLDLGADKGVAGRPATGDNPAMGLRAIRLGLREPDWLMPQLRALLRAAARGPIEIMLPMVAHPVELRQFRELLAHAHAELKARGVRCTGEVPVGVMIEVPGAALAAAQLARHADFLSLGTNDLIQYTLAVDRGNDEVNYLYDPLHPAVLKLIATVLNAGRRAGVPVSLCGEMAGDARYTRLLLGLGLTRFSMHPSRLLEVKQALTTADTAAAKRLSARLLNCIDPQRATELLDQLNA